MEAQQSGEAVDDFDLRSEDAESLAKFKQLCNIQTVAALQLIDYVTKNADVLRREVTALSEDWTD